MQRPRSPYDVLNVSPDAEPEVIEAAFRVLMKKYHPDKAAGGRPISEDTAAELNRAFKILRDPGRRRRHDAEEKARRPVIGGADWTFDGNRAGAPFAPKPQGGAPAGPARPPMPPPRRRDARLIAGWTGILAAALAVVIAILVTRQPGGAASNLRAAAAEVTEAAGDLAGATPPVNQRQVGEALVKFERVRAMYGAVGVAAYSDACFDAQRRSRDLGDFDFCVAFDHAASALDNNAADPFRAAALPRFSETQLDSRHSGAAKLQPQDYEKLEERLADIRTLTYSAIADKTGDAVAQPAPEAAASAATAPRRVQRRPEARSTVARPRPPRSQRPAPEADFVEREGGIY